MGTFKDLEVFQLALQYAKSVYQITQPFPSTEQFGLTNQMRRAAIAIPSSIAEGSARRTATDRKHFVDIALGSLNESHAQLILAVELGYMSQEKLGEAERFIEKLKSKLFAYHKSIKSRPKTSNF
ncbi:MAG: four helix bundle protein [Candidatus Neomarinimicrobiota bacterium]